MTNTAPHAGGRATPDRARLIADLTEMADRIKRGLPMDLTHMDIVNDARAALTLSPSGGRATPAMVTAGRNAIRDNFQFELRDDEVACIIEAALLAVPEPVTEMAGSNYIADDEVYPQRVTFANGRVVSLVQEGDRHFLDVSRENPTATLHHGGAGGDTDHAHDRLLPRGARKSAARRALEEARQTARPEPVGEYAELVEQAGAAAAALKKSATFSSDQYLPESLRRHYGSIRLAGAAIIERLLSAITRLLGERYEAKKENVVLDAETRRWFGESEQRLQRAEKAERERDEAIRERDALKAFAPLADDT